MILNAYFQNQHSVPAQQHVLKNIGFFLLPLAGQQLLLFFHKVTLYFACRVTGPSKKITEPAWGSRRAKDIF